MKSKIGGSTFDEVPILSLCNKVEGLEGKSRLELVLLKPGVEIVASPTPDDENKEDQQVEVETPPVEPWAGCVWELQLCEEVKVESPVEVDFSEEEEKTEEVKEDTEPPTPQFTLNKTVLSRWADSTAFDSFSWHSIALTLQASGDGAAGNVGLVVDGTGRMKMDGPFEEGTAAAWLPSPKTNIETLSPTDEVDDVENKGLYYVLVVTFESRSKSVQIFNAE